MSHYREKEHHDLMFCCFFLKKAILVNSTREDKN